MAGRVANTFTGKIDHPTASGLSAGALGKSLTTPSLHIMCERDVGLFSLVQQVIGNIPFALYERRVPIAYFGPRCSYWTAQGYRERDTVWEYYFEPIIPEWPVSTVPKHIRKLIEEKPPLHWDFGYYSEDGAFITNNYGGHQKFKGKSMVVPFEFDDPSDRFR